MRILNDAEDIAEWVENSGNLDALANILNAGTLSRAERKQSLKRSLSIGDTPIDDSATRAQGRCGRIGIEAKLVTADAETDVERLVEVRRDTEDG